MAKLSELLRARQELVDARKELRSINATLKLMERQVSEVARRWVLSQVTYEPHLTTQRCHVCGSSTLLCCSDCAINFLAKVYVCSKPACCNEHERKCFGPRSPDTYTFAPREPTEEMISAGLIPTAAWQNIQGSALTVNREKMRLRYMAMIAVVKP